MDRKRRVGVCIAAACAAAMLASAPGASALPEVGRCVAQPGSGKYKNASCTEKAGKLVVEKAFEFLKGAGGGSRAFTLEDGGAAFEGANGTKIGCAGRSAAGEYREVNGAIKEVTNVVLRFSTCFAPLITPGCTSEGAEGGEIVTSPLKGRLGYISGKGTKTPVVGLELTPMAGKRTLFAKCKIDGLVTFDIGQGEGLGGDRLIATVGEVNAMNTTTTLTLARTEPGVQKPQSFEGIFRIANLEWDTNGGPFERISVEANTTIDSEQPLEIKA